MNLFKSTFVVSFLTILSRIAGYIRDIFIAATMGAGPLTDAFLVAFRLPNFFRRLFAEGAFSAAFIPLFSSILTEKGKAEAINFVERTMSFLVAILLVLTMVFQIFMPFIMYGIAPGFASNAEQFDLTIYLTRITFPYLLFISIVSLFGGVLNTLGKFAAAAAAPILLNVCLIAALFLLDGYTKTPAHSLAWGVAIAGVVQAIFLFFCMKREGIVPKFSLPKLSPDIKKLMKLMIPGTIGVGVVQINLWVDTVIATMIPNAVSYLYYADRLNQLPLAVIGTAIGTVLLPMLARQIKQGNETEALHTQNRALELSMFFTIPAAAAFMIIAYPIISVLFARGEFSDQDAVHVSYALVAYAVGLPAFVMVKIFIAPFFARQDTKTPVKVSIICLITNVVLNLLFIYILRKAELPQHVGIALATSIAGWLNIALLYIKLREQKHFIVDKELKRRAFGITISSIAMILVLYFTDYYMQNFFGKGEIKGIVSLAVLISLGGFAYLAGILLTRTFDIKTLMQFLKRKKKSA